MRIEEVLAYVDETKPHQYDDRTLIAWLNNLEGRIVKEVIETHESEETIEFNGYTEDDMSKELLVPEPYTDLYAYYLFAMIDFHNGEFDRYTDSRIMFNNALSEFKRWYNRNHMPVSGALRF